jgi:hypothetical protein
MAFTPEKLPSGRWRASFRHPVTKKRISRTFDEKWEAEAWATTAERDAKLSRTVVHPVDTPQSVRDDLRAQLWAEAMLCITAADADRPDEAKEHAAMALKLRRILLGGYRETGGE